MLNQQFFVFFEEQQQVARILREGLRAEGMKSNLLLPERLLSAIYSYIYIAIIL